MFDHDAPATPRHTRIEDAQALVVGTLFVALGVAMFRHAGLLTGGTAGIAFLVRYASGWRAGKLHRAIDIVIVAASFAVVSPARVLLSVLGAVALNLVIAVNHRPGRYLGM